MSKPMSEAVSAVFAGFPEAARSRLLLVRDLIFEAAAAEGVGPLTETLKWGEPAYLTEASKAGSTIRLGWKPASPRKVAIYFNCKTTLVESFRATLGDELAFDGARAVLLDAGAPLPVEAVKLCVAAALTYHRNRKASSGRGKAAAPA
jgi:hypothetical protein